MVWLCFGTTESLEPGRYFGAEAVPLLCSSMVIIPRNYICSRDNPEFPEIFKALNLPYFKP